MGFMNSKCLSPCSSFLARAKPEDAKPIRQRSFDSGFEVTFPMWVMPVSVLVDLDGELEPHQVQLEKGRLVIHEPGLKKKVIFVSHQWRGRSHPDVGRVQFKYLQDALRNLSKGVLPVSLDIRLEAAQLTLESMLDVAELKEAMQWYVWYDFFSCPQIQARDKDGTSDAQSAKELQAAVDSIPFYVAESDYFLVLAPTVQNDAGAILNYSTWQDRGWCRVEQSSCLLAGRKRPMLSLTSATTLQVVTGSKWLVRWPGQGNFTVEADRAKVQVLVEVLMERMLQRYGEESQQSMFRFFQALRPLATRGLKKEDSMLLPKSKAVMDSHSAAAAAMDAPAATDMPVDQFLAKYKYQSITDAVDLTPLMCAVMEDNATMVSKLFDANANISAAVPPLLYDEFGLTGGTTTFGLACQLSSPNVVAGFLQRNLDVNVACDGLQATPLIKAANCGNINVMEYLLEHKADIDGRDMFGLVPLSSAVEGNFMAAVETLLRHGADPKRSSYFGSDTIAFVSTFRGDTSMMLALLEARGDPNIQDPCEGEEILKLVHMAREARKSGQHLTEALSLWSIQPVNPLLTAAWAGQEEHVKLLLQWRADPAGKTWDGSTAADIAAWRGEHSIAEILRSAAQVRQPPLQA